ncbi:MAG: hypothetical protein ACI9VR_005200, partial [Cognaticolwellia sp.]
REAARRGEIRAREGRDRVMAGSFVGSPPEGGYWGRCRSRASFWGVIPVFVQPFDCKISTIRSKFRSAFLAPLVLMDDSPDLRG